MKVLVTGSFGYIGTALVQHLVQGRHDVVAMGRMPKRSAYNGVRDFMKSLKVPMYEWDVGRITYAPEDVDAVVHLAGDAPGDGGGDSHDVHDAHASYRDNVESVRCVAECVPERARKVLASSAHVYGRSDYADDSRAMAEDDPCAPDTLFGAHKLVAESLWARSGAVALRFSHVYGVGSGVNFERDDVTELLAGAVVTGEKFLVSSGSPKLDLVHVDDACQAVALALVAKEPPAVINVGGGAAVSAAQLANAFFGAGIYGEEVAERGIGRRSLERRLDVSLAVHALGWTPTVSLATGARGLIESVRGRLS